MGREAKEMVRKKKEKGYSVPSKKRKYDSSSDDHNDEPPKKKRKITKNEKLLKEMLKKSSVLLQDEDEKLKIEIVVNDNKSYSMIKGKIGNKGRKQNKKFKSKKQAFDAALNILLDKMEDGW